MPLASAAQPPEGAMPVLRLGDCTLTTGWQTETLLGFSVGRYSASST